MKIPISLFSLALALLVGSCFPTTHAYKLEPHEPTHSFWQNDKLYSYEGDSVVVSVGFVEFFQDEFVLDLGIENLSADAVYFDPSNIYVIPYSDDNTVSKDTVYYPLSESEVMLNLDEKLKVQQQRINRNNIASALLGVAFIVTEIAMIESNDFSYPAYGSTAVSHEIAQTGIDVSTMDAAIKKDDMAYRRSFIGEEIMRKSNIDSGVFNFGKVHVELPYSPQYRIYIPVENRIYRFAFSSVKDN